MVKAEREERAGRCELGRRKFPRGGSLEAERRRPRQGVGTRRRVERGAFPPEIREREGGGAANRRRAGAAVTSSPEGPRAGVVQDGKHTCHRPRGPRTGAEAGPRPPGLLTGRWLSGPLRREHPQGAPAPVQRRPPQHGRPADQENDAMPGPLPLLSADQEMDFRSARRPLQSLVPYHVASLGRPWFSRSYRPHFISQTCAERCRKKS